MGPTEPPVDQTDIFGDPITPETEQPTHLFGESILPETEQPAEQTDIFGDPMTPEQMDFPEPKSPSNDVDPWQEFRDRVNAVKLKEYGQAVKDLRQTGLSKTQAKIRAYNEMLTELQKELRTQYTEHLKWVRKLKDDPIHQAVIDTRNKLMEEEAMDADEAIEAAVNQWKYLLNRVFEPIPEPETDDQETDEDTDTEDEETADEETDEPITEEDTGDEADDEAEESLPKINRQKTLPQQTDLGRIPSDVFVGAGYF